MSRHAFAKAMNVYYQTVDAWDIGKRSPSPENLAKASKLLGYSMEELQSGERRTAKASDLPEWEDFVESSQAKAAEEWMLDAIREFPWPSHVHPNLLVYKQMLFAMQSADIEDASE